MTNKKHQTSAKYQNVFKILNISNSVEKWTVVYNLGEEQEK
jgi:hypothetical protein